MILNQLVTEFLFKGSTERLEKYNKDLETSKKKLSELKESQKDFNKFFREEEKKLKDELKSLNISDFTSAKTKNLRKSLADIKDAIKIEQLKDNPDRATVKSLKRREYRLSKGLTASEAKDKRELEKITTATNKQFKDTQKNHKIAMAQAEEKIETEKESQEATKEKIKEENKGMHTAGLALGRFTMALGVASMAVGAVTQAFNYARNTIGKYQESAYGTGVSEEEMTQLANVGATMTGINKDEMLKSISAISTRGARAMQGKDPAFFSELGEAGLEWYGSFAKSLPIWRELWKAGKLDETRLATVIDPNIFRMMDAEEDFLAVKARTPYGATRKQNKAKMEAMGRATEAMRTATVLAGGGRMPDSSIQNTNKPIAYTDPLLKRFAPDFLEKTLGESHFQQIPFGENYGNAGNMTINQNNTYNIHTNNPDVAGKVTGKDINILKSMTSGGDND